MRVLVVGAGASYAEAREVGLPPEFWPPLVGDFASQLWRVYSPGPLLSAYLASHGYEAGYDPVPKFLELARRGEAAGNIERFFAFAYERRGFIPPGHEGFDPPTEYENLLLHGILGPLSFLLIEGLLRPNPEGTHHLPLGQRVAARLRPGDLVLSLNYDTVFEHAAEQAGHSLSFVPNPAPPGSLEIAKPHGSMNLFVDPERQGFYFARPLFGGALQAQDGSRNYLGFVPPRFGKSYEQHPVAAAILEAVRPADPLVVTFWGVGLTDSDVDLLSLFRQWAARAAVEFVNPDPSVGPRASALLGASVAQYEDVSAWEERRGRWIRG